MANTHDTLTELFDGIADAIRSKTGLSEKIKADNFPSAINAIEAGEGGITPSGTVTLIANGTHDVTSYAYAEVAVPANGVTPSGRITITENGEHDVTNYARALVNVPTTGGEIANGEDIEVDSLSELHAWSKYTIGGTVNETAQDSMYVDLAQKGSVDGRVYYADNYSIVDGALTLNNPTLIDLYNASQADRQVILGKYINPVKSGGYYLVPSDAVITRSAPATGYHYVSIAPVYKLSYSGADGEFVGIVVSEDSTAYPQNGEQDGFKYVYNGTLDSNSAVLKTLDVTPSATQQIFNPPSGYDGFSRVTVAGDAELIAGNIRSGVSIFGVAGSYEGTGGTVLPTLTTPGAAGDLASGKQLIDANGNVVTGTVKDSRSWFGTYNASPEIYTSGSYKYVMFKHTPSETTMVRDTVELCADIEDFGDATAADVAKGKTFTSADGLKVTGTYEGAGGTVLPTLTTPGTAGDLAKDKQLIGADGNIVTGTVSTFDDYITLGNKVPTLYYTDDKIMLAHEASSPLLFRNGFALTASLEDFGNATKDDVRAGKTFTSQAGLVEVGNCAFRDIKTITIEEV